MGNSIGQGQISRWIERVGSAQCFFAHFLLAFFPLGFVHFFPWVAQPGAQSGRVEQFLSLPFLSILWNGSFPVCVFFVLSGYVLTKGFVERGDIEGIRSKAARRYFRLGIPVFFSVMFAYLLMKFGAYHAHDTVGLTRSAWLEGQVNVVPDLVQAIKEGIFGALFKGDVSFNPALWTMRMEFIGSMLIFAYRLIAWRGRRGLFAAAIYMAFIIFLAPTTWPYYLAFLLGSYIGEWPRPSNRWIAWGAAIVGIGLGCVDRTPMFALFNSLPFDIDMLSVLYRILGGALLVYGVRGGVFEFVLSSRPVQFFGRISYSLYLVHLPLIFTVGCGIFNWLTLEHGVVRSQAVGVSLVATLTSLIFVAWLFEKFIDAPAIRFAKFIVPSSSKTAQRLNVGLAGRVS